MSNGPEPRPVTQDDLRALAVQLADRSHQLHAALALELDERLRRVAADVRGDVEHLTDVALGELRIARHELIDRARGDPVGAVSGGVRLDRRLIALIVGGNAVVAIANAVVVVMAG